jgi:hypothetical protein
MGVGFLGLSSAMKAGNLGRLKGVNVDTWGENPSARWSLLLA